jgi:hypothetical protein
MGVGVCSKVESAPGEDKDAVRVADVIGADYSDYDEEDDEDLESYIEDSSSAATDLDAISAFAAVGLDAAHFQDAGEPLPKSSLLRSKPAQMLEDAPEQVEPVTIPEGVFDIIDLSRPYAVFKEGLFANNNVNIRVGPIVGKVTDTTAILLLEADRHAEVSLNFARIYEQSGNSWTMKTPLAAQKAKDMLFWAEGSVSVCHFMEPNKPCTFEVWGLQPETSYLVLLSNASQEDMNTRMARFQTLPSRVDRLRLVAVCGNSSAVADMENDSPWWSIMNQAEAGPDVHIVLHVGSTIDAAKPMMHAAERLSDFASYKEGMRKELEMKAQQDLGDAYRAAWGAEIGLRCALAQVGTHLSVFSPPCEIEAIFRGLSSQADPWITQEWEALLRVSTDVYYSYQRALWNEPEGVPRPRRTVIVAPDEEQEYLQDEFRTVASPITAGGTGVLEEWHFHKYGRIGIFLLDTKGGRFYADGRVELPQGTSHETCPMLSHDQWAALKTAMHDDSIQVLVVAGDIPFFVEDSASADNRSVDYSREPPEKEKKEKNRDRGSTLMSDNQAIEKSPPVDDSKQPAKPKEYPLGRYFDWCSRPSDAKHPNEIIRLLSELFTWKHQQYPSREVVLISGGTSFGSFGDVCDHKLGLSIPIVITGPVCGKVSPPRNWALCSTLAKGRFSYAHRTPLDLCNFCTVDIDFKNAQKPTVDCQLVSIPLAESVKFAARPTRAGTLPLEPELPPPPLPPPGSDYNPSEFATSQSVANDNIVNTGGLYGGDDASHVMHLLR